MSSLVWHDVECGAYDVDLPLWETLAAQADGPVLDLGCGSGRVGLHLARRGHRVTGLDLDPDLIAAFEQRADGLPVTAVRGDARRFELGCEFALALAPMQLLQLFAGAEERLACLTCVAAHLGPGGVAAFAIVESMPEPTDGAPPLPDTREIDGWVYSSLPLDAQVDGGEIRVRRLRQTVSPEGEFDEAVYEIGLHMIDLETLAAEARDAGLVPAGRRTIPPSEVHVGSTVVLFGAEA